MLSCGGDRPDLMRRFPEERLQLWPSEENKTKNAVLAVVPIRSGTLSNMGAVSALRFKDMHKAGSLDTMQFIQNHTPFQELDYCV